MTNDSLPPPSPEYLIQLRVYQEIAKGKPVDVDRLAAELLKDAHRPERLITLPAAVAAKVAAAKGTAVGAQAEKDRLRLEPQQEEERGKVTSMFPARDTARFNIAVSECCSCERWLHNESERRLKPVLRLEPKPSTHQHSIGTTKWRLITCLSFHLGPLPEG